MADKEKIQDTAAESVTGGAGAGIEEIEKLLGGKGSKLVASLGETAAQIGQVVVDAAKLQNGVTGTIDSVLKAEGEKSNAGSAVGIVNKKVQVC